MSELVQKTSATAPIWKGSSKLIEQPDSPDFSDDSSGGKCTRVFVGPWDEVFAAMDRPALLSAAAPSGYGLQSVQRTRTRGRARSSASHARTRSRFAASWFGAVITAWSTDSSRARKEGGASLDTLASRSHCSARSRTPA